MSDAALYLLYILDENDNPVAVENTKEGVLKWSEFFQNYERRSILKTEINGFTIYTNFLSCNSNIGKLGRPLLWGTAVKYNKTGKFRVEYEFYTKDEALACHKGLIQSAVIDVLRQ